MLSSTIIILLCESVKTDLLNKGINCNVWHDKNVIVLWYLTQATVSVEP